MEFSHPYVIYAKCLYVFSCLIKLYSWFMLYLHVAYCLSFIYKFHFSLFFFSQLVLLCLIAHLALAAGFYICWGCLVWVPSIYTSPGMYLVNHPVDLGTQVYYCPLFIPLADIMEL